MLARILQADEQELTLDAAGIDWIEHFQLLGVDLMGNRPVGRATVQVLAMNADELLRFRMALLQAGVRFS
jgi:hypothetical protein